MKVLKFLSAIIGLLFITANFAYGQESIATTPDAPIQAQVESAKTINVKVKGVGCSRDIKAITLNVGRVQGVNHCKTVKKGATTTFEITFNPGVATEDAIYSAVENTAGCSKQSSRPYKVKL